MLTDSPSGWLRSLAAEATPGPWCWTQHERGPWQVGTCVDVDEEPVSGFVDLDEVTPVEMICESGDEAPATDARLIALAPDLAVLCADAIDALEAARKFLPPALHDSTTDPFHPGNMLDDALARFAALQPEQP